MGYTVIRDSEASAYFRKYTLSVKGVASVNEILEDKIILQVAIMSKQALDENKQVVTELNDRFSEVSAVTSGDKWVDRSVFGDSLNVQTMMEVVEYSISKGNDDPDLVEVCHY